MYRNFLPHSNMAVPWWLQDTIVPGCLRNEWLAVYTGVVRLWSLGDTFVPGTLHAVTQNQRPPGTVKAHPHLQCATLAAGG